MSKDEPQANGPLAAIWEAYFKLSDLVKQLAQATEKLGTAQNAQYESIDGQLNALRHAMTAVQRDVESLKAAGGIEDPGGSGSTADDEKYVVHRETGEVLKVSTLGPLDIDITKKGQN